MEKAVEIEKLSVSYGENEALSDIDLVLNKGDYLGIIGPNGGGKTTLLKAALGLIEPDGGTVRIFGKDPGKHEARIGYVPQFSSLQRMFPIKVEDVVLEGMLPPRLRLFHRHSKAERSRARELLGEVGLQGLGERSVSELSGGEFQRLLLARALAREPELLLLDEPTANVDPDSREIIYTLLNRLNEEMTIVLITHDLSAVSSYVKTLACLNKTLIYHGGKELTEDAVAAMYGCPVDLIAHGIPHRVLSEHVHGGE